MTIAIIISYILIGCFIGMVIYRVDEVNNSIDEDLFWYFLIGSGWPVVLFTVFMKQVVYNWIIKKMIR